MATEFYVSKSHHYTQARGYPRVTADFPVQVLTQELRVNDRVADISESGVGVHTSRPLAPMALVPMRLEVPHVPEPIQVLGRVMWASEQHMGIRFEQRDPRLLEAVSRLRQNLSRL